MLNQLLDRFAPNSDGDRRSIVAAATEALSQGKPGHFQSTLHVGADACQYYLDEYKREPDEKVVEAIAACLPDEVLQAMTTEARETGNELLGRIFGAGFVRSRYFARAGAELDKATTDAMSLRLTL